MTEDTGCARLRERAGELALGVLSGRERAEALAHLDRCADCREYVDQLALVGDGLLALLPEREPPRGFEERVARRLSLRPVAAPAGAAGRREAARGRAVRIRVAAVAGACAVALGFGGWALGTYVTEGPAPATRSGTTAAGLLRADLVLAPGAARVAAGAGPADHASTGPAVGRSVGEINAHPAVPGPADADGWVYMSVDMDDAGVPYDGPVSCLLVRSDGSTVRLGSFRLHEGYGYWGSPAAVNAGSLAGARLTTPDGTVLATARF
ncbi:hypothetical protein [Streptomyces sp. NPDC093225]|uniref:hypothetical protein n=1 Tax=Streptomyces sp. NPDC093225 TaxID=3366034 RepID=UPI00380E3D85